MCHLWVKKELLLICFHFVLIIYGGLHMKQHNFHLNCLWALSMSVMKRAREVIRATQQGDFAYKDCWTVRQVQRPVYPFDVDLSASKVGFQVHMSSVAWLDDGSRPIETKSTTLGSDIRSSPLRLKIFVNRCEQCLQERVCGCRGWRG